MTWNDYLGQPGLQDRFRRLVESDRLAHTYLFVGQPGVGKKTFASLLAQTLLCEGTPANSFEACGQCPACQQVTSESHPDLVIIRRPPNKSVIPLELFIGDKEHRRQQGLCHDIGLKPFRGGRKIAIIADADDMNQEGANSLLKTLEEPPPRSLILLIGTSEKKQLPTILSRSQTIRFGALDVDQIAVLLQRQGVETPLPQRQLALAADGSFVRAMALADPEVYEFRRQWLTQLASLDPAQGGFAKQLMSFIDAGGKDGAEKRRRFQSVAEMTLAFFHNWLHAGEAEHDDPLDDALATAERRLQERQSTPLDNERARVIAESLALTLEMQRMALANVQLVNVVHVWLNDLGRIARGEFVASSGFK